MKYFNFWMSVHECKYENVILFSFLLKNNMPDVSHYNTVHFLRYTHLRYMKGLFTNIEKHKNMLKNNLLFKKNTNFKSK